MRRQKGDGHFVQERVESELSPWTDNDLYIDESKSKLNDNVSTDSDGKKDDVYLCWNGCWNNCTLSQNNNDVKMCDLN